MYHNKKKKLTCRS